MKLEDVRKAYYDFSGTLSNINRQLALSGIAIIWIVVHPNTTSSFNFGSFQWAFMIFCCALLFDLIHYGVATLSWGLYHRYKEKSIKASNDEFSAPSCLNWIPITMTIFKVIATVLAYFLLIHSTFIGNAFK